MAQTHTQTTHGHRDLETESAQWADSVTIVLDQTLNSRLVVISILCFYLVLLKQEINDNFVPFILVIQLGKVSLMQTEYISYLNLKLKVPFIVTQLLQFSSAKWELVTKELFKLEVISKKNYSRHLVSSWCILTWCIRLSCLKFNWICLFYWASSHFIA